MASSELSKSELVHALLAKAGLPVPLANLRLEARDDRWLIRLPENRVAWFANSESGVRRLQTERRILRLLASRCTFRVPRVLFESQGAEFDVRSIVPGNADPLEVYALVRDQPTLATQIGVAVGNILAEQHARIAAADVASWLPWRPSWPESRDWIHSRLAQAAHDRRLIADAQSVMDAYEDISLAETERALVHTDLGLHNLAIDPASYAVQGVFDYDSAAWGDRHHDFRYLVFDFDHNDLFDAAASTYESIAGHRIDRERVLLYNATCAISYLAFRAGSDPEDRVCGRTLAEDLNWSKRAISRVLEPE